MSVTNFLAPIQVRMSPNLVSHTLGHSGRGDKFLKVKVGGEVCTLLSPSSSHFFPLVQDDISAKGHTSRY